MINGEEIGFKTMQSKEKKLSALYPGSFDPITFGHLDLIKRLAHMCDEVIVGIGQNPSKPSFFTFEERLSMVTVVVDHVSKELKLNNIRVASFSGLAVDFARKEHASLLIRGLRSEVDFPFEMQMALMNRALAPDVEVLFILGSKEFSHISSSLVKEIASYGRDISSLVPELVAKKLKTKINMISGG